MKIGIDLGGSHVAIGIVNEKYTIIEQFEKDFTEEEKKHLLNVSKEFIIEKVKNILKEYEIESIGMAIPGTIKDGIILRSVNLGIENYNIVQELEKELNFKVKVKNDTKCAAIGEYEYGSIKDKKSIIFLTLGTGIGGAFIYNGEIVEGSTYEGFEIGHMLIKQNGLQCNCGKKGCFEKYGSILRFKNEVKERLGIKENISGSDLRKEISLQEEKLIDIQTNYVHDVSLGLSNLINIFEPDVIVLGGGFARYDYMFLDKIKKELLNSSLLFNKREDLDLRVATLGNDAGIIGASCL